MAHHPHHRIATLLAAASAVSLGLSACAAPEAEATIDDVAIVITPTMGATALTSADLAPILEQFDTQGDHLTVVEATGTPAVIADVTLPELDGNSTTRGDQLTDFRSRATSAITSRIATTPEIDLAEAIALAGASLTGEGHRELVILGSGLSTKGAMSMTDGRLYADPADLVANAATSALPDLDGVDVTMPKLGVVTSPQETLDAGATRALTDIWTAYFSAAGAQDVDLSTTGKIARPYENADLPPVTSVPIDRPEPISAGSCRKDLPDAAIGFSAGHAGLIEPDEVRATIAGIVDAIGDCAGHYRIEASASSEGDAKANLTLTNARARTIAGVLADVSGSPVSDMTLKGWGEAWPCRQDDIDANGRLILTAASANRVVVISKTDTGISGSC